MWLPVFETLPAPEWFGTGAKLAYIVAVRMVGTVLANVLVWASEPFYEPYKSGGAHYGIGPLADQQLAGGIMLLYDSVLTLVAIAWLFLRMAQESDVRQRLIERGLDERAVRRAVRYGRWRELEGQRAVEPGPDTARSEGPSSRRARRPVQRRRAERRLQLDARALHRRRRARVRRRPGGAVPRPRRDPRGLPRAAARRRARHPRGSRGWRRRSSLPTRGDARAAGARARCE